MQPACKQSCSRPARRALAECIRSARTGSTRSQGRVQGFWHARNVHAFVGGLCYDEIRSIFCTAMKIHTDCDWNSVKMQLSTDFLSPNGPGPGKTSALSSNSMIAICTQEAHDSPQYTWKCHSHILAPKSACSACSCCYYLHIEQSQRLSILVCPQHG